MGLIAPSFLGTPGTPFPLRLGTTQVSRDLALVDTKHPIIYLGFNTTLVSSGAGPGTLTREVVVKNPSLCILRVSIHLGVLSIHFTDIGKEDRAHPGLFRASFDPSHLGGRNCKNCDCTRMWRAVVLPFGHLFL